MGGDGGWNRWVDGWTGGWGDGVGRWVGVDGWVDARMHGWMDGWMDGWGRGWMDGCRGHSGPTITVACSRTPSRTAVPGDAPRVAFAGPHPHPSRASAAAPTPSGILELWEDKPWREPGDLVLRRHHGRPGATLAQARDTALPGTGSGAGQLGWEGPVARETAGRSQSEGHRLDGRGSSAERHCPLAVDADANSGAQLDRGTCWSSRPLTCTGFSRKGPGDLGPRKHGAAFSLPVTCRPPRRVQAVFGESGARETPSLE